MDCQFRLVGSLEKVRPCAEPPEDGAGVRDMTMLPGDRFSFQIAYKLSDGNAAGLERLLFDVDAPEGLRAETRSVALAPMRVPCFAEHDDDYLTLEPGLMPDILMPYDPLAGVRPIRGQWRSLWISVEAEADVRPGPHTLRLACRDADGRTIWRDSVALRVLGKPLPPQELIYTQWFHADCLADYYHVEAFGEAHWRIVEKFAACAARHGVNMLMTPVFTPPLDTRVGGERTTVQLIDVEETGDGYRFGFDKLDRWVAMCDRCGVRYIEICPLFTQWGAKAAPKVMVRRGGALVRAFGWDTPATGEAYQAFLRAFLPALIERLRALQVLERTFFHISDEPDLADMEAYRAARDSVLPLLAGCRVIDALSSFELYRQGLAPKPVVATNHIQPFLDAEVPGLWAYYCCGQGVDVSNRFMSMPSCRNRVLGVQLYLYRIEGFLQWGYNFYNSQHSVRPIDPYRDTDAGEAFPSGDAFSVYPGTDGDAVPSLRLLVFQEALNDLRALQLLEALRGRAFACRLIREEAGMEITFSRYPREADFLYRLRGRVNRAIAQAGEQA